MALNSFVKPAAEPAIATTPSAPVAKPAPAAPSSETSSPLGANPSHHAAAARQVRELAAKATQQAIEMEANAPSVVCLSDEEVATLRALAALQIKYGHATEAVPYLMLIRKTNPEDVDSIQLLAKSLMRLNRWDEADVILAELQNMPGADTQSEGHRLVYLYRSIAAFKTRRVAEARSLLARFRDLITGAQS